MFDQQDLLLTFNVPGVWSSFAKELQAHNGHPKAITQVAIDMSPVYIRGVKDNFGNGAIVFDKFHIVQAFLGFSTRWILLA